MPEAARGDSVSFEREFFRGLNAAVEPWVRAGWFAPGIAPAGLIVLETVGRRSGERRRVPLGAVRLGPWLLVSTVRGRRSQWARNLAANPGAVRWWLAGREVSGRALAWVPGEPSPAVEGEHEALRALAGCCERAAAAGWACALLVPGDAKEEDGRGLDGHQRSHP